MTETMQCMRCGRRKPITDFPIASEYHKYPTRNGRVMVCGCKKSEVKKARARAVNSVRGMDGEYGAFFSNMGTPGCYRLSAKGNRD